MEIDCGDNGLFKAHGIFRPFIFALLLKRSAENLPFNAPDTVGCDTSAPLFADGATSDTRGRLSRRVTLSSREH